MPPGTNLELRVFPMRGVQRGPSPPDLLQMLAVRPQGQILQKDGRVPPLRYEPPPRRHRMPGKDGRPPILLPGLQRLAQRVVQDVQRILKTVETSQGAPKRAPYLFRSSGRQSPPPDHANLYGHCTPESCNGQTQGLPRPPGSSAGSPAWQARRPSGRRTDPWANTVDGCVLVPANPPRGWHP